MSAVELNHGLIIAYFGKSVEVETNSGIYHCHLRRNQPLPVVGDQVICYKTAQGDARIKEILPRHGILARGEHGLQKPLAANIDQLVIVMAPPPILSTYLIDRYLIAANLLRINALIVVNKADLMSTVEQQNLADILSIYATIDYPTIVCSLKNGYHMDLLNIALTAKTSALVGPSGVGKSSLIAHLVNTDIKTTAVSAKGAGKHTTTGTRLYHLPCGGNLIDSPGVRDFNLWSYSLKELQSGFPEFTKYLHGCKFRDCQHLAEPGCQLLIAADKGIFAQDRWDNYLDLAKSAN